LNSAANKSETTHFQRVPLKTHQPTPFWQDKPCTKK